MLRRAVRLRLERDSALGVAIAEDHLSVALQRIERSVGGGVVFFAVRDMVAKAPQRRDEYVHLADLASYLETQQRAITTGLIFRISRASSAIAEGLRSESWREPAQTRVSVPHRPRLVLPHRATPQPRDRATPIPIN